VPYLFPLHFAQGILARAEECPLAAPPSSVGFFQRTHIKFLQSTRDWLGSGGVLQFPADDITFFPATPVKRRGKSMSRRTGENGHIEESDKWYVGKRC
jgi:hypothetical protein